VKILFTTTPGKLAALGVVLLIILAEGHSRRFIPLSLSGLMDL